MTMTDERINSLLHRFMEGESSVDEEAELGRYFRSHQVKPEWQAYQEMFAYFDNGMKDETADDDLNGNAEDGKPSVSIPADISLRRHRVWWFVIPAVAAAVTALLLLMPFMEHDDVATMKNRVVASVQQKSGKQQDVEAGRNARTYNKRADGDVASGDRQTLTEKSRHGLCHTASVHAKCEIQNVAETMKLIDGEIAQSNDKLRLEEQQSREKMQQIDSDYDCSVLIVRAVCESSEQAAKRQPVIQSVMLTPSKKLDRAVMMCCQNIQYR